VRTSPFLCQFPCKNRIAGQVHYIHCVSKNAPTFASCSFNKHGLIWIIFDKQHQHTLKNAMHFQLSLCLHFFLLYLLLNSCDGNNAFWRYYVLVKQSSILQQETPDFSSPDLCPPNSPVELTTEFVDLCRNVRTLYIVQTTSATPAAVTSDLMQRLIDTWKSISKKRRQSSWSMEKAVVCMREGERTSLWTSAKLKPALFRAINSLPRKRRCFASFFCS